MKRKISFLLAIAVILTSVIPTAFWVGADASEDIGNVSIENLKFAYGLRATEKDVSLDYDAKTDGYAVTMPSNSKHIFLVSDKSTSGKGYTVSSEYKMSSSDKSASIGLVLGASKSDDEIDLTTAYKLFVYRNQDLLRFSSCDYAGDPSAVGTGKVSFDSNNRNIGVTYDSENWNTVSLTVAEDGVITCLVNGVQVYTTDKLDYIDGYIGLYAYLPGTQFRNFNMQEQNTETEEEKPGFISIKDLEFGYGLRATAEQVSAVYNSVNGGYEIMMPSNSKHIFLVSDTKSEGKAYTASVEYKMASTDKSASIGLVLGIDKDGENIDLTTAYKMQVYKSQDQLRFSACDGATPDIVGNSVSFDKNVKNAGVTYKENEWNVLTVTVTKEGSVTCLVNGVQVYTANKLRYIDGYVGLYAYLPGTQFRNFEFNTSEEEVKPIPDSDGINLAVLELAYALRAESEDLSIEYDERLASYKYLVSAANSKHYFLMSDTKAELGAAYRLSVDYKMDLTDKNASVGFVFGVGENAADNKFNFKTAYKTAAYGNSDSFRFSSCDGENPEVTGAANVSLDSGILSGSGVTYKKDGWNNMSVEVYKDSVICCVNGIEVFKTLKAGNIGGYVGLYSYLTGSSFKNFKIEKIEEQTDDDFSGFFYDLTKKSTIASVDGRNIATNLEYNEKDKNMTVSANLGLTGSGSTTFATFYLGSNDTTYALPKPNVSCEEYPVLAMKIRLNDKTSESGIWKTTTDASQAAWEKDNSVNRWLNLGYPTYIQSNDWQIVYIDVSKLDGKYFEDGACWKNIQFSLVNPYDSISSDNDIFSVEWIGAFAKVEDIRKVDGSTVLNGSYTESGMKTDTSIPARLFYDFSKISYVNRVTIDNNGKPGASTAISHDPINGAMKVSVLPNGTSNGYAKFYLGTNNNQYALPSNDISCDEYPVLAMKVKLKNPNISSTGIWLAKTDGKDTSWSNLKTATYRQTDDWQVVYIDTRYINTVEKAKLTGNHWKTFAIRMISNNKYDAKANYLTDVFFVSWFGAFKSIKDARTFGGETVEESSAKFLYDFSNEGTVSFAEPTTETKLEYDANVGAMKVSVDPSGNGTNHARFYLGNSQSLLEQGISCREYPVIAMRVKLNSPDSKNGVWHYKTTNTSGFQTFSTDASKNYEIPYQKTTDWQTVVINTAETDYLQYLDNATWQSFSFRMVDGSSFSPEKDIFWVSWVAGFATEKEAIEFSGIVTDEHEYVAVIGDELTYGVKAANRNTYPINLQTALGSDFTVKSFTASGAAVQQDVKGSFRKTEAYKRSVEYQPGIAVIMLGTNDSNKANWKNAEQYKKDLISLIEEYKKLESKPMLYLCTTPYIFDELAPGSLSNSRVKEIVQAQKEAAKQTGIQLIDTYKFLEGKREYYFNGVYLNDKGYPAMAEFIADKILKTYVPKNTEYIYKIDSVEAVNKYIEWSNSNDTEVSFDAATSSLLVKAADAKTGEAADGVMATNVAGFTLNTDSFSTGKYPVMALHLKLGNKNAKAGWFGFETTSSQGVNSAKRPIYESTDEWQTVILDFSDPESNTMLSAFGGNWKALALNLGVDNLTAEGQTFNVSWIGFFQTVDDAQKYAGIKPPADETDSTDKPKSERFNYFGVIIPVCATVVVSAAVIAVLIIKKRRKAK